MSPKITFCVRRVVAFQAMFREHRSNVLVEQFCTVREFVLCERRSRDLVVGACGEILFHFVGQQITTVDGNEDNITFRLGFDLHF